MELEKEFNIKVIQNTKTELDLTNLKNEHEKLQ